jgi:tRNA pseudouridine13 synthase
MNRLNDLPYAYGLPFCQGVIRQNPEDFIVQEQLGFTPSGSGEHVFLQIEKCGENTDFVAGQLARFAGVAKRDIGFAGLKDRHAITTQTFSVWLPGRDMPDWVGFATDSTKILNIDRHSRKLKRGALLGNDFTIRVRDLQGKQSKISQRLEQIKQHGVANYFGEQRFGYQGRNIENALALFKGAKVKRQQRSIYLSAARSYLFNQILSKRVELHDWDQALTGDLLMLDQSGSFFKLDDLDENIIQRMKAGKIHPTGALWGQGTLDLTGLPRDIECAVIDQHSELANGLEQMGLKLQRRALRVNVDSLTWQFIDDKTIELCFFLPAGSYATAVLRECFKY